MIRCSLIGIAVLFLAVGSAEAQCCSAGSPVGGTSNLGAVTAGGGANLVARAAYSVADRTYDGSDRIDPLFLESAVFYQVGLNYTRGLSRRFSAELDAAIFHSALAGPGIDPDNGTRFGLEHASAALHVNIYRDLRWEVTTGAGIQYVSSAQKQTYRGSFLVGTIKPSVDLPDFLHSLFVYRRFPEHGLTFFLANRIELKGRDTDGYAYGDAFFTQLFASYHVGLRWDAILQVRSEVRNADRWSGRVNDLTGSRKFFVVPQVAYTLSRTMTVTGLLEIPVYQHFNGIQIGNTGSVGLAIIKRFDPDDVLQL